MTDTPTSPLLAYAQQALKFERSNYVISNVSLIAFVAISVAGFFGLHVPGGSTALWLFGICGVIASLSTLGRNMLATHHFYAQIAWLEQIQMSLAFSNAPPESEVEDAAPVAKAVEPTESGTVIDLMNRLRGDDEPQKH